MRLHVHMVVVVVVVVVPSQLWCTTHAQLLRPG